MDEIFDTIGTFKSIRDAYDLKYDESQEERKLNRKNHIKVITPNNNKFLTREELESVIDNLEDEYNDCCNKYEPDDFESSIPMTLPISIRNIVDKSFTFASKKNYYSGYGDGYDEDDMSWDGIRRAPSGLTPPQNYRASYLLCIDILSSHGIQIIEMARDASRFTNFTWSTCGISNPHSFVFKCQKNNYSFTIKYDDDCDCYPGLFCVYDLVQISPYQKIIVHDVRLTKYSNKMSVSVKDFITLLNSENYETYVQNRFGHFLRLPNLLKSANIEIMSPPNLIIPNHLHINTSFDYTYVIVIKLHDIIFDMILNDDFNGNYCLFLGESLEQKLKVVQKENYSYVKISSHDYNTFHHNKNRMKVKYQSDDDFKNLLNHFDKYCKWKSGQYGFYECDKYFNDKNIPKFKNLYFESIKSTHKNFIKYQFNLFCTFDIIPRMPNVYTDHYLKDLEYPLDFYGITFYYDSVIDANNCVLTIESKMIDATPLVTNFYTNDKKFDKSVAIVNDSCYYIFQGKYSECIQKLVNLDNFITEIKAKNVSNKLPLEAMISDDDNEWTAGTGADEAFWSTDAIW